MSYQPTGAWNAEKVRVFREMFMDFLNHVYIDSKELGPIPLGPNLYEAQIRFLNTVFDALADDIHDIYVLKSRQLGLSTITRALTVFWLGMHEGLKGSIVLDTKPHTDEARLEIKTIMSRLPENYGFPTLERINRDGLILGNNSTSSFLAAGVKQTSSGGGLGRGSGINFAHCSEMCMWQNTEGLSSFRKSLAKDFPNRLYIWESTGRGFNDWYKLWTDARADDLSKRCVFLGWWSKPNQRLKRGTALFERYGTAPPTKSEQEKIDLVKQLYDFEVDQEQLAWYRKESNPRGYADGEEPEDDDEGLPDDEYFGREQPWTEDEAFSQTGATFFPAAVLTEMTKVANETYGSYDSYMYYLASEFLDMSIVRARNRRETMLKVWEEPQPGATYIVSGDPAFGANENNDRSSAQVIRCYADKVDQVAEFCSSAVKPYQFAWVLMSLAAWYNNARLILEIQGPGAAVWREYTTLKKILTTGYLKREVDELGLKNFYNNCKNYIYARTDALTPGGGSVHWKTTSANKVELMERLRDAVMKEGFLIRSTELLGEMRTVVRNGDAIAAENDEHDDRVLASAFAIRCWEDSERSRLIAMRMTRDYEMSLNQRSLRDQYELLSQYAISAHFRDKAAQRRQIQAFQTRQAWRGR